MKIKIKLKQKTIKNHIENKMTKIKLKSRKKLIENKQTNLRIKGNIVKKKIKLNKEKKRNSIIINTEDKTMDDTTIIAKIRKQGNIKIKTKSIKG